MDALSQINEVSFGDHQVFVDLDQRSFTVGMCLVHFVINYDSILAMFVKNSTIENITFCWTILIDFFAFNY